MRKLLFIMMALIGAISMQATAQTVKTDRNDTLKNLSTEFHYAKDTLVNGDTTKYTFNLKGVKRVLTIETITKKIDGTPAGTLRLLGTIDGGTSWDVIASDTLINGDKTIWMKIGKSEYATYQLELITTGTQRCWITPFILYRE